MFRSIAAAWLALGLLTSAPAAADPPSRIVAVGGSVAEILFALGVGETVIAVDTTSTWPAQVLRLPNVGYMRSLSAEPLVSLGADLIIAESDAGPEHALAQVAASGVRLVRVPDQHSVEGVKTKIRAIADEVGRKDNGEALIARLEQAMSGAAAKVRAHSNRPRVLFVLSTTRGAMLAAGLDTSAAAIIELAGGANAVTGFTGFKPLSSEAVLMATPDIILVTARTVALAGGHDAILSRPDIAATPAGRAGRLVAMDGLLLLGFGPRTGDAVAELAASIHAGPGPAAR